MKKRILVLVMALIPFGIMNSQELNSSFIIITAESSISLPARDITFSLQIEQADTNAQNAFHMLKSIENKLVKLLKEFEIPDSNIAYSLSQFRLRGGYRNEKIMYTAGESVVVKLNSISQYEPFQISLLSIGIYSFNSTFSSAEIKEARKIGYVKALEKAKLEANTICNAMGRELGEVLEVESKYQDYVVSSNLHLEEAYTYVEELNLIDIPQSVTLKTNLKVKYALK